MSPETAEPGFVSPMLAVPGALPKDSTGWSAEIKWDGIRLVTAVTAKGDVRCWTRAGRDVTGSWPEVTGRAAAAGAAAALRLGHGNGLGHGHGHGHGHGRSAVFDGEIVALDRDGRPSFARLQQRIHLSAAADIQRVAATDPATLMVFDLLRLDGADLTGRPWQERRARLEGLDLGPARWQVPPAHPDPAALLAFTAERGLEGVVCKRRTSIYRSATRSPDWVKVKHVRTQEVVLGGWLPGQGARTGELGALLLGIPEGGGDFRLRYVGRVGTGFTGAARMALLDRLGPLAVRHGAFSDIPAVDARDARWVEPLLVGEVAFAEWTVNRRLRQPSWRGLRIDKDPAQVVVES